MGVNSIARRYEKSIEIIYLFDCAMLPIFRRARSDTAEQKHRIHHQCAGISLAAFDEDDFASRCGRRLLCDAVAGSPALQCPAFDVVSILIDGRALS